MATTQTYKFVRNTSGDENSRGYGRSVWHEHTHGGLLGYLGLRRFLSPKVVYGPVPFAPRPLFSVDAERASLGKGVHFAIGAVVMGPDRHIIDRFEGRVELDPDDPDVNDWVKENVVPHVRNLPLYDSYEELLEAFWQFWSKYRDTCDTMVDAGYPVETSLFQAAQNLDLATREFQGPNPLHELAVRLDAAGIDTDVDRVEFAGQGCDFQPHNPVDDATVSAHCSLNAGELLYARRYFHRRWLVC